MAPEGETFGTLTACLRVIRGAFSKALQGVSHPGKIVATLADRQTLLEESAKGVTHICLLCAGKSGNCETGQFMLDRMELYINTPFCYDAEGRMRTVNKPEQPPAPRFYMVHTQEGNHWRFRYDLLAEPPSIDLACPPQHYAAIKAVLAAQAPLQDEYLYQWCKAPTPRSPSINRLCNSQKCQLLVVL